MKTQGETIWRINLTPFSLISAVRDKLYRSMGKPSIVDLDGIKVAIDPAVVPRAISKAIARGATNSPRGWQLSACSAPEMLFSRWAGHRHCIDYSCADCRTRTRSRIRTAA